jgi:hypothetical protein
MSLCISGTFTYDAQAELIVLKAYIKGTQPIGDMAAQVERPDGNGLVMVNKLWLRSNLDTQVYMSLRLNPVVGVPGQPLRRKLILLDKFSRKFTIGPIEFPYIGPKI